MNYAVELQEFTEKLNRAIVTSRAAMGISAGERLYWASVLLTRMCTMGISTIVLCPGSKLNPRGGHWDFTSIASLVRNLIECSLFFFYLTVDPNDEDEWVTRLNVMQLHDCLERHRMFSCFGVGNEDLKHWEREAAKLVERISKRATFLSLSSKLQKEILRGNRAQILTQDEILERMQIINLQDFRGFYRFLSSQSHTYPLGFYRMGEQDRRGHENDVDKEYIASALHLCVAFVERTVADFQKAFDGLTNFDRPPFDWALCQF